MFHINEYLHIFIFENLLGVTLYRSYRLPNKRPSANVGYCPSSCWVTGVPKIPQTIGLLALLLVAQQNLMVRPSAEDTTHIGDRTRRNHGVGTEREVFTLLGSFHSTGRCFPVCWAWEGVSQQFYPAMNAVSRSDDRCARKCPWVGQWHECNGVTNRFLIGFKAHSTGNICLVCRQGQALRLESSQVPGGTCYYYSVKRTQYKATI